MQDATARHPKVPHWHFHSENHLARAAARDGRTTYFFTRAGIRYVGKYSRIPGSKPDADQLYSNLLVEDGPSDAGETTDVTHFLFFPQEWPSLLFLGKRESCQHHHHHHYHDAT